MTAINKSATEKKHFLAEILDAFASAPAAQSTKKRKRDGTAAARKKMKKTTKKSRYTGVSYQKSAGKWLSFVTHKGKKDYLGSFDDEIAAAKAYDAKARILRGAGTATNFNLDGSPCEKKKTSVFKGVSWNKATKSWWAQLKHKGQLQQLGRFEDEIEAALVWDAKATSLRGADTTTNF